MPEPIEEPPVIYDVLYEPTVLETLPTIEPIDKPETNSAPPLPENSIDNAENTTVPTISTNHVIKNEGFSLAFTGMPIAQYLVQPRYPARAATKGVEGYVDVKFDISKIGTTQNIRLFSAFVR